MAELYELLDHPSIVRRDLDPDTAAEVAARLAETGVFDVCAGHVTVIARRRGWPALTTEPDRLRCIDPEVDVILV